MVSLVAWVVRKLRRYTTFAQEVRVIIPTEEDMVVVADPALHLWLRAQVVELQQYPVRWVAGENPWAASNAE